MRKTKKNKTKRKMSLKERIRQRYPSMTDALRQFGDFVLNNPVSVASMSIHKAVKSAGVSVATADRFVKSIGFASYPDFRVELIQSLAPALASVRRLEQATSRKSVTVEIFRSVLREDLENIQNTLDSLEAATCQRAVDLILKAERVFIVGFDNGAALAHVLMSGLIGLKDNVASTAGIGSGLGAARFVSRLGRGDLVIAIAFPRYIDDAIKLAQIANSRGVRVLAITDNHTSPLAALANISLYMRADRRFSTVSNAAALAVIEALLAAVTNRTPDAVQRAKVFTETALPWLNVADK